MDRLGGSFDPYDADDHLGYDEAGGPDDDYDGPPSPVGQDERRMQVRAYNHWASLLGDRNLPDIEDLEPELIDDFGPYSVLLDFSTGVDDPAVRFVGHELAGECDTDGTIEMLSDVPPRSLLSRITDHYMQIIANQAPIGFEAEFVNQRGVTVLYRGILLPYSSDRETIDFIYGVINWKEMADQRTADALLLEIGQALGDYDGEGSVDVAAWQDDPGAAPELGNSDMMTDSASPLPQPAFGLSDGAVDEEFEAGVDAERMDPQSAIDAGVDYAPRLDRSVDALGNPIGMFADEQFAPDMHDDDDEFDSGLKTAADYGLPDWDDDEDEEDDVDGLVDPLADEEASSSLTSLVSRGLRQKKSVDLSRSISAAPVPQSRIPQAYEPEDEAQPAPMPTAYEPEVAEAQDAWDDTEFAIETPAEALSADEHDEQTASVSPAEDTEVAAPEGLYDSLAAAREMAQTAQNTEDRSRKALYGAVSRAYDFSLEAKADPAGYEELIADNGLTVQDRAPMTPVVKLVFGADYDKTRLTEYAAVLMHGHRLGVERGSLGTFLAEAEGGLKGVLQAERRARREEQGKPVDDSNGVRDALAKKLREIEPVSLHDIDPEDGAEFALVMVRRTPEGELLVLGEVPEDVPLVEKAARKLLG